MQQPQEGEVRRNRRTGATATFRDGQWWEDAAPAPGEQAQPPIPGFVPFESASDRRNDARLSLAEDSAARQARNEERRIAMDSQTQGRQGIEAESQLRDKFNALPEVREFPVVRDQFEIIRRMTNQASPAGDLALVTAYMKMLDPGSVVREQEFANAANAGGAAERAKALISDITGNGILTDKQRADFVAQSRGIFEVRATTFNARATQYRTLAEEYGYSPDNIAQPVEIDTAPIAVNQKPITEEEQNNPNILAAQGYRYDGGTDTWVRDPNATEARDARSEDMGLGRRADAFVRGAADGMTFGLADKIAAGANTVLPLDRGSVSGFGHPGGFQGAYDANMAVQSGVSGADAEQMPLTRLAGQVTGAVAAPGGVAGARYIAAAPRLMTEAGTAARGVRATLQNAGQAGIRSAQVGALGAGAYSAGSYQGSLSDLPEAVGRGAVNGAMVAGPLGVGGRLVGDGVGALTQRAMTSPRGQQVQLLRDSGVSLTPGQAAGGMLGTVENLAQRAPILGSAIRGARERGVESMNRAKGNIALAPIGEGVPASAGVGGEMVDHVQRQLGAQFDRAYAMVPELDVQDPALLEGLSRIGRRKFDLPEMYREQFDSIVSQRLQRLQGAVASGETLGGIRSELNTLAGGYLRSGDKAQQDLGSMIADLGDELDGAISRASPEAGAILQNARTGYTDYIQLERASTAANGRPFSPGQLENAVKASDGSVRHGAMGRGNASGQAFANAARTVMPDQFGNPGTADAAGIGAISVGMLTEPVTTTGIAAGLGAAATPYLMMGRKVVERLPANASRQQLEAAASELDGLAQQDSNVIVLRDEIARRLARVIPAAAQQSAPEQRLMTGTPPR